MTPAIPGAEALVSWFGSWPSFHDAEILELHLNHSGPSWLKVHAWRTTDKVGEDGHYDLDKHVVITFRLEGITQLSLEDVPGSILFRLSVEPANDGHTITLDATYGLYGYVTAKQISLEFSPGEPVNEAHP